MPGDSNWKQLLKKMPKAKTKKRKRDNPKEADGAPAPAPAPASAPAPAGRKRARQHPAGTGGAPGASSGASSMSAAEAAKIVAIDCEMVGCGADGRRSILARASAVDGAGAVLYDKYVQPTETVTDYRTAVSGIRPADVRADAGAITFRQCQAEVAASAGMLSLEESAAGGRSSLRGSQCAPVANLYIFGLYVDIKVYQYRRRIKGETSEPRRGNDEHHF